MSKGRRDGEAVLPQDLAMHYVTVFDAAAHPYRNLTFVLPGVGRIAGGSVSRSHSERVPDYESIQ